MILMLGSCVSFMPPSSLHQDMIPNIHPMISDSLQTQKQIVYGNAYRFRAKYQHNTLPEMEKNKGAGFTIGYGYAERKQSAGLTVGYMQGNMIDNKSDKYRYSNIIVRGSYALDFHEGRWHGHILKVQGAASKGSGRYQSELAEHYVKRDQYNLAIPDGAWLWSFGYGTTFNYIPSSAHDLSLGFYMNHSTDFDQEGFRADFLTLDLGYLYQEKYRVHVGGMFDSRLIPRGESIYLGLGYQVGF